MNKNHDQGCGHASYGRGTLLLLCLVVLTSFTAIPVHSNTYTLMDQYPNVADVTSPLGENSGWQRLAVYFNVSSSYNLGRIDIPMKKIGSPTGLIDVAIWNTTGAQNTPDTLLYYANETLDVSTLTTSYVNKSFYFTGFTPTVGVKYMALVNRTFTISSSNYVGVGADNDAIQTYGTNRYDGDWNQYSATQHGVWYAYELTTVSDTGSLEVFSANNSDSTEIEDTFLSGQEVYFFMNWTNSSDVPITNDTGYCELTLEAPVVETAGADSNFTLCGSVSCDHEDIYSEEFTGNDVTNLLRYDAQMSLCFNNLQGVLNTTINITCDSGSTSHIVQPQNIPLCSDGSAFQLVEGDGSCNGDENVTLSVYYAGLSSRQLEVTGFSLDAVQSVAVHNMTYNATLELWEFTDHDHEWYEIGTYDVNGSCRDTVNGERNATDSHQITIYSDTPQIFFNTVTTDCNSYNLTDGMTIEYCDASWLWRGSVVPSAGEVDTLNVTWLDASSNQVKTYYGTDVSVLTTDDEDFIEFDNPYQLYVWFNQTDGNSAQENLSFIVNDTVNPTITIFNPVNQSNLFGASTWNFDAQCTDEALYRFNQTIYDIVSGDIFYSYEKTAIEDTLWYHEEDVNIENATASSNSSHYTIAQTITCSDAHTGEELLKEWLPEKTRIDKVEFFDGDVSIELLTSVTKFDVIYDHDRYVFDIESSLPTEQMIYKVSGDWVEVKNSDYPCHAVNLAEGLWFDAVDVGVTSCDLEINDGYMIATAHYDKPKEIILTKSIGELNVWNETYYYAYYDASVESVNFGGIVCGEKYPNNVNTLTLTGLTNCTIRLNDAYIDYQENCTGTNLTSNIGWNVIEVTGLNALGSEISSECSIFTDKYEKTFGDFIWIFIIGVVILLFVLMSVKIPIFMVMAGVLTIVLGFTFWAFSYWLAMFVMFGGFVMILSSFAIK